MNIANQCGEVISFVIAAPPNCGHIDDGYWLVDKELAPGATVTWTRSLPPGRYMVVVQTGDDQMSYDDIDLDGAQTITYKGRLLSVTYADRTQDYEDCD